MKAGKSGYVDLAGDVFVFRLFWEETYDESASVSVVQVTDVQVKTTNDNYINAWYPGGECSIDGEVVFKMDYNNPATHYIAVTSSFKSLEATSSENDFPWTSGEIAHESDGSKTVVIALNVKMYSSSWESSWGPYPNVKASTAVELTRIARGTGYIQKGASRLRATPYVFKNGAWKRLIAGIYKNGQWKQPS